MIQLLHGDCLELMKELPDCSVDACVTDPPYGLSFMGKAWDYYVPSAEVWREVLRVLKPGGHLLAFAGTRTQHRMAVNIEDAGFEIRDMIAWVYATGFPKAKSCLKPALEPITMARKPSKHVQPLNIDDCRVPGVVPKTVQGQSARAGEVYGADQRDQRVFEPHNAGRWPANLIHDGSEEVTELFPHTTSGQLKTKSKASGWNGDGGKVEWTGACGDSGSAARFFYCAKANKKDREEGNSHPTVKPTELMRYLCRLVTPPGGVVLDPFMGSGSTGKAAVLEGFEFIGIEREAEYLEIARNRIELPAQGSLL